MRVQLTLKEAIISELDGKDEVTLNTLETYDMQFLSAIHDLLHTGNRRRDVEKRLVLWCEALKKATGHDYLLFSEQDAHRIAIACQVAQHHPRGDTERADKLFAAAEAHPGFKGKKLA